MTVLDRFDWYYADWAHSLACFLFGAFVWHYRLLVVRFAKHVWEAILWETRQRPNSR